MKVVSEHKCLKHNVQHEVEVPKSEYLGWQHGMYIQDAMPSVSASDREILMTGTCQEAWDEMFPPDEEDLTYEDSLGQAD